MRFLIFLGGGSCNKLYKISFLDKHSIRFPNQNVIREDNPFFFKVITLAEKVDFSTKYLYTRREGRIQS